MQPAPQTDSFVKGESVERVITVLDSAGAVVNITGATPHFALGRRQGGAALVGTELSPANATASLTDAPNGVMTVTIDKTVTVNLLGSYYGEAWVDDASGNRVAVTRLFWTIGESVRL